MTDLIARLKDAAGKATPGEWRYGRLGTQTLEHVVDFGPQPRPPFVAVPPHGVCHGADESGRANAAYIVAAQPANILALLAALAELKGQWERMLANYASADARAERAEAEIDKLREALEKIKARAKKFGFVGLHEIARAALAKEGALVQRGVIGEGGSPDRGSGAGAG